MTNRRLSVTAIAALTALSTVTGVVNAPAALAETAVSTTQSPLSLTVSAPSEAGENVVIGAAYEGVNNGNIILFLDGVPVAEGSYLSGASYTAPVNSYGTHEVLARYVNSKGSSPVPDKKLSFTIETPEVQGSYKGTINGIDITTTKDNPVVVDNGGTVNVQTSFNNGVLHSETGILPPNGFTLSGGNPQLTAKLGLIKYENISVYRLGADKRNKEAKDWKEDNAAQPNEAYVGLHARGRLTNAPLLAAFELSGDYTVGEGVLPGVYPVYVAQIGNVRQVVEIAGFVKVPAKDIPAPIAPGKNPADNVPGGNTGGGSTGNTGGSTGGGANGGGSAGNTGGSTGNTGNTGVNPGGSTPGGNTNPGDVAGPNGNQGGSQSQGSAQKLQGGSSSLPSWVPVVIGILALLGIGAGAYNWARQMGWVR